MEVTVATPSQAAYQGLIIAANGAKTSPRGLPTLERRYVTLHIAAPWQLPVRPGRKVNPAIGAIEACSLIGQVSLPETLTSRVMRFQEFMRHGVFWGAYGPRVAGQVGMVVDALSVDPDSRQAVISIYDGPRDLMRPGVGDVPCTVAIQFMIREGALECRVVMRSQDAYLGLPYDLVQFPALQGAIAAHLGIPMGAYVHQVGSLHVYESDLDKVAPENPDGVEALYDYVPLFGEQPIAETARWCRTVLMGDSVLSMHTTPFERWLTRSIR